MSLIKKNPTTYTVTREVLEMLILADLGADPNKVILRYDPNDSSDPRDSGPGPSRLERIEVTVRP